MCHYEKRNAVSAVIRRITPRPCCSGESERQEAAGKCGRWVLPVLSESYVAELLDREDGVLASDSG